MSIEKLLDWVGQDNIADDIMKMEDGKDILSRLSTQVIEDTQRDLDSMSDWIKEIEEGQRVAKQETNAKSEPWEGASNFKSPDIMEAAKTFGDRAVGEVLRGRNLIKLDIIGKDPEGTKRQASENVSEFMNWQINHEMEDWRDIQESLLYHLPTVGTVFKKIYFDTVEKVNETELIHYPNFIVNQSRKSMVDRLPFTQPMDISKGEVEEYKRSGIWADVDIYAEDDEDSKGSNAQQEVKNAEDNSEAFLEQHCFFDLDGDGYAEPWIVTVHKNSRKVVRIVARFYSSGIFVKDKAGNVGNIENVESPDSVVKIKPSCDIVKYGFIRDVNGNFLDKGYYHILTSLSKAKNAITNQLIDSGTLANLQGGFTAKGFRKAMGNVKFKPGSYSETNIDATKLQTGILQHQFKEPSPTLLNLCEKVAKELSDLSVNMDLLGTIAPNAPATTTLALIQEAAVPTSTIIARILRSESVEFQKLFMLNYNYTDPIQYKEVLGDPEASYKADFDIKKMNVVPTANAEMSSKIQRVQQSEVMVSQAQIIGMLGGDVRPIYERWFDAIGADDMIDQVWPSEEDMTQEQADRMQEMKDKQEAEKMLVSIDIDHKERELEVKERLANADMALKESELRKNVMDLQVKESEIILNLEKAESEQAKNQISMYSQQRESIKLAIDATLREIEAINDRRTEREVGPSAAGAPNSEGGAELMAGQQDNTAFI